MLILALTARRNVTPKRVREFIEQLDLGNDVTIELITVDPPTRRLPVSRVDCVDPSVLPWRPTMPVAGPGVETWAGARRGIVRALRGARRAVKRVPVPDAWQLHPKRFLEIACATSNELRDRAQSADVIVALEGSAARAAWHLARRVDGPTVVSGANHVRLALLRRGVTLPPSGPSDEGGDAESAAARAALAGLAVPDKEQRLLIGPANYAAQGYAWARAVRLHCRDATAINLRSGPTPNPFPADLAVDTRTFAGDLEWRLAWRDFVMRTFTHVIIEANLSLLGEVIRGGAQHADELRAAGKRVAMLSHGSDARIPSVHRAKERWHSYDGLPSRLVQQLEDLAHANAAVYNSFPGTVFVSTPGLLEFIPAGVWLPLVVDVDAWASDDIPLTRAVPVVAHIPSSSQKGSHMIDPILQSLAHRGHIEYLRVEGVPHAKMADLYRSADIMVEQFGIADYSVAACEAMAAGRVVVSRVADGVRTRVREDTGRDLPIVEANPETLETVILDLAERRDLAREQARAGQDFVRAVHDGRRAATVLADWMASSDSTP